MDRGNPTTGAAVPKQRGISAFFGKRSAPSVADQMETLAARRPYFVARAGRWVLKEHAEDVCHTMLADVQKFLENGGVVEGSLMGFAMTSLRHAAVRHREKLRRAIAVLTDDGSTPEQVDQAAAEAFDKVHDEAELKQRYLRLRELMAKELTAEEREACLLTHFQGLTSTQAGQQMGKEAAAVRQAVLRARSKINLPEYRERFGFLPEPRKVKPKIPKPASVQPGTE